MMPFRLIQDVVLGQADLRDRMVPLARVFDLVGLEQLRADEAAYLPSELTLVPQTLLPSALGGL